MTPRWKPLALTTREVQAHPTGLWTLVADFVEAPALLMIKAADNQTWAYSTAATGECGPDGDLTALLSPKNCLCETAPVGALIGKIGGSSAAAADAKVFAVGRSCVFAVPDGGPLYLTINDQPSGMENNARKIDVDVWRAESPPADAAGLACSAAAFAAKVRSFVTLLGAGDLFKLK